MNWGCSLVVKHLPGTHKALGYMPDTLIIAIKEECANLGKRFSSLPVLFFSGFSELFPNNSEEKMSTWNHYSYLQTGKLRFQDVMGFFFP